MKHRILLHLIFWLAYWFVFAYTYSRYDGNLSKYLLTEAMQMPARMLAAYAAMWSFQRLNPGGRWQYWPAFTGAAVAVLLGGCLNRLLKWWHIVPVYFPDSSIKFWDYRMMYDIFDCVIAASTALTLRLYFQQQALERREAALRAEKLDAELLALKRQVQPHFLFNTINNLYGLARKQSEQTAPVALKLANLLRYVLYETARPTVRMEQEIKLLQDYVALEKLRFDPERLKVVFEVETDNPDQPVPPLLLLPLVENAFKHGVNENRHEGLIQIQIRLANGLLNASIQNTRAAEPSEHSGGIGLQNLSRQLELTYPNRHRLEITNANNLFTVRLEINL